MLKVAVIPAGSVGAYFGARLVQAGAEVRFLARGQHLRALQEQGLKVRSVAGDFRLEPGQYVASNDPAKILAEADLVFFAPKSKDTEGLARQIEPVLEEKTVLISLQNGVDNEPALAAILGADRVAQGAAYIESYLEGPGEVVHLRVGRIEVASTTLGGRIILALDELKRLSERANFGFETTENGHNL